MAAIFFCGLFVLPKGNVQSAFALQIIAKNVLRAQDSADYAACDDAEIRRIEFGGSPSGICRQSQRTAEPGRQPQSGRLSPRQARCRDNFGSRRGLLRGGAELSSRTTGSLRGPP